MIEAHKTINPHSMKFTIDGKIHTGPRVTYLYPLECDNDLAKKLLMIPGVTRVSFNDDTIILSKELRQKWNVLKEDVMRVIENNLPAHNPDFQKEGTFKEYPQIKEILDRRVVPYIQSHGGDIRILSYDNNCLKIQYIGACTTCPSSYMGTLEGITEVLREEFNPYIVVDG